MSRGGPDGGDGGTGGDVWLVATRNVASLLAFRDHPHRRAENGVHGQGKKKHGAAGADIDVPVPEGTQVKDRDGILLADLAHAGDRWRAVEGGRGGRGNARFLSNRRRAPAFAEQGEPGDEIWFDLELKLLADVALVGFPNVGKSTLIARISAARPKIADYPFTTLEPNLGVVRTDDAEFVVADIPGLIEGASEGKRPRPPVPAPHRTGQGPGHPLRPGPGRRRTRGRAAADPAGRTGAVPARPPRPTPARGRLPGRHGHRRCHSRRAWT